MRRSLRILATIATAGVVWFASIPAAPALAHGIGGRADLPVPIGYFMVGASAAVVVSFVALSARWTEPRLQQPPQLTPIRARWLPAVLGVGAVLGLVGLVLVVADGLAGGNVTTRHISPSLVWVLFWLVAPYLAAVLGNFWLWTSPWRSIGRWIGARSPERTDVGARIGVWPATIAFLGFTWLELVSPNSADPGTLAAAALVYTLYLAVAMRFVGVDTGLSVADAFENYYYVISAIAPFDLSRASKAVGTATALSTPTLAWRGWLRGLPGLPVPRGMPWFVIALIGTVAYDGMSTAEWWDETFGDLAREAWFGTLAIVAVVLAIGAAYYAACAIAARIASGAGMSTAEIASSYVHTLHPIAFAYAFAHYFTLVLFEGQQLIHAASDPFGFGWNLLGTADWRIVFFVSPEAVWWIQLAAIVAGHIAATVLAHDRALFLFDEQVALRTQYAMLGLMVALTSLGLFILAG